MIPHLRGKQAVDDKKLFFRFHFAPHQLSSTFLKKQTFIEAMLRPAMLLKPFVRAPCIYG
jgi:hypothetical protein